MPSRRLTARTALDVALSATITRNLLTNDPGPVLDELRALAGGDHELLAEVSGRCSGYYQGEHRQALCAALAAEIEGAAPWVEIGRERRSRGTHGAPRNPSRDQANRSRLAVSTCLVVTSPGSGSGTASPSEKNMISAPFDRLVAAE